jgi:hypothetical protein
MNSYVITEEQLKAATGYTSNAHLKKHLDDVGVRYHVAKQGRIYTTYQLLNSSLEAALESAERTIEFE